ncbi:MAG TPA: biotin/lipoyl-binding protein [Dysgonomonas sp.]|uniref:efflux RND transporter periplasmic adaptor subunit n=1 Tax=unclassified Dysgonomonas TaxID=2630389 RepID=UPI0025BE35E2|nr:MULTISPECIES: biotin/lipoyl-binding protein [unclassified Dysgonomonas]HML65163.1 biotin/lipoyl-binding protein [Dysgonomonas sp.]
MKKAIFLLLICITGCTQKSTIITETPRTSVTITQVKQGNIKDVITLTATTCYQNKSIISTPIAGYITKVYILQGSKVTAGQSLYQLESKERNALNLEDSTAGVITIKAGSSGIITVVNQQEGGYLTEGTLLCTIADQNSFVFNINVPYEFTKYVNPGKGCTLILPDETEVRAAIGSPLVTMNTSSQSQQIVARAKTPFLPEGLIVKVLIDKGSSNHTMQILPKSAVQSDVMMQNFWVMKLINDSVATKLPVKTGNSNTNDIEIVSPILSQSDRIVLTGAYAMEDSTLVKIVKE